MPEKPRIVLDTNLWVSYFLGAQMKERLDRILYNERFSILLSSDLFEEISGVLARPKFARYFSSEDAQLLLDALSLRSELIEVTARISLSRDQKDDFALALCQDGKADFLITGDSDLLVLHPFGYTQIVRLAEFAVLYGG
ncbi:MAG: putative toxin-antitoxin system toxin component, PIN family [Saprospiraceae bacterium]